jgi:DNA-binding beta-propeller fold protein YncE
MKTSIRLVCLGLLLFALTSAAATRMRMARLGKQPDGSYMVSTGQRIVGGDIAFAGRPLDLAMHPSGDFFAVLNQTEVFLCKPEGIIEDSRVSLGRKIKTSFRGLAWTPDGKRLFASTHKGYLAAMRYEEGRLRTTAPLLPTPDWEKANPVPGGMAITRDGKRLFVAAANRNAVVEMDLATDKPVREYPVQNIPFEPRLSEDERTLIVSNWGGRPPRDDERKAKSDKMDILVDERGTPASGTVSLIELATGKTRHVDVGIHPTAVAVRGRQAFVANSMSDSISVLDIPEARIARTIPIRWGDLKVLGSMPTALAVRGETLYVCNGGDNALCKINIPTGKVRGFRPAGFYPLAVALSKDDKSAFVLNTKGNGSVLNTRLGKKGNAHDFQGTVSVLELRRDLARETAIVAANNRWDEKIDQSTLKVYNGAIKHVLYIIKENRTYDEIFGDLKEGNGDPKLCSLGEKVMPNHRALARRFTLFDNAYVSGTNSADGHAWSTQSIANDYLEHFYSGYSRAYPDDGDDAMALSSAGALWDAAVAKKLSLRVWGEFCDDKLAAFAPKPQDWFEVWEDRKNGGKKFKMTAETRVAGLKPYINHEVHYWPLLQSDQFRADVFIREYEQFSKANNVPNLMILSLPCDHSEGLNPKYPTPRAMMADNDLALGRVVEAVSRSPQWKETCIFVIEDDAQSGPDHVDGHRTCFLALSPYTRRGHVDSTLYTTTNMVRSIELMLGLEPLNRFDALAYPMQACFHDRADLAPYTVRPNNVALDERNPSRKDKMTEADRWWMEKSLSLDWSHLDAPDPYWLNRIVWYSIYKDTRPYPARPGEEPGVARVDDDD